MFKILFVCMGNICRSPTAEGFFRHHLERSALAGAIGVDSAGTHEYHLGNAPDPRAVEAASCFGVDISKLRARRVTGADFHDFDRIVAMDQQNLHALQRLSPGGGGVEPELMMAHAPRLHINEVPDPYYGGPRDFQHMCELLDEATRGLLQSLETDRAVRS
jgi:protein-tyrosine phosphatase